MKENFKIRKCLFLAAGYGTRFLPPTKATPEEILPVLNKPPLQYGVEEVECGEIEKTGVLLGQAKKSRVIAYKFQGQRFDCGSVDEFVKATNHFYNRLG